MLETLLSAGPTQGREGAFPTLPKNNKKKYGDQQKPSERGIGQRGTWVDVIKPEVGNGSRVPQE